MNKKIHSNPWRTGLQIALLLVVSLFVPGMGRLQKVYAEPALEEGTCGQMLAEAEAQFLKTLAPDGSVPASPENRAAASEYIRVSKLCYEEVQATNNAESATPSFIDEGGVYLDQVPAAEFALQGTKWGSSTEGTPGGTVTYSFMGNGISLSAEDAGNSVAITSLPAFQACFITKIQNAFAAWQVVSNITFVQVSDNGAAFDAPGATGDIRIAAHAFDGPSGVLAHAYFPPPNGTSAAGDLHFDSAERWTCNTSGIDIGMVALHEIGHALGLNHEKTDTVAVMDPYYNSSLAGLQADDINGVKTIYGTPLPSVAPSNDDFANPKTVSSVPYSDTLDTTGADASADGPQVPAGACDGKNLNPGLKDVWYVYAPGQNKLLYLDTFGTSYDTYVAVWTGSALNNLELVGCDDDTPAGLQSQLMLNAQAGVTYYIEVAQHGGDAGSIPPTATGGTLRFHATSFEDVPGNYWAWRWIEGLSKAGITGGCLNTPSSRQYCPGQTVTREQMALFLLRGKHGSSYTPPPATGVFADVAISSPSAPWIEQLAAEGITGGCNAALHLYCPTQPVTRAQMAIFLLRGEHGSSYTPPAATGVFGDVPISSSSAPWIEQLAAEGITGGCSTTPKLYCPTNAVTRDQMAVFLDRTFGIAPIP